jgi:radical SAM superfamily enzyme YgiQ (UPF0313 family)
VAVSVERLITSDILKPARYLGNERLAVNKPWDSAVIRWVLTYPELDQVGASNLGQIILYNILNAQPRQLCDRAYLLGKDLGAKLRATHTPLFAVESKRWLIEFDILGFSLSYELSATNILKMLDLAGIPKTWQERSIGNYPLVFVGGQTATSNPEPYADYADFFALGDGEELLPEIGLVLAEGKQSGLNREQLLLDLAQIPGVYVPQFYHMNQEGCTRGCRFCQLGMLTRPGRDVEPEKVIEAMEQGMRATGYNEFSLLSLSCSDYLSLPFVGMEIKNRLKNENISLSLPSQRVDRFDQNIANILGETRQSGLTFASEAGTQRMQEIVNKGLTNEELLRGVKTAWEQGWDKIKLYFMIGSPGETDDDVLGIAEKASAANQSLLAAEYLLTVTIPERLVEIKQWESWICQIRAQKEIWSEQINKSGKQQLINLRDRLFEIELVRVDHLELQSKAILRYLGTCCPVIGVILRSEQILSMLEVAEKAKFHLLHIHRQRLVLGI